MNEEQLFNLSDEELEREYLNLKNQEESEEQSPVESEETFQEEETSELLNTEDMEEPTQSEESISEASPSTYKIKANGKEYDFTLDELQQLAPKAMDYTQKLQAISPYRKMISAIEAHSLTQEDINTLIDIKQGDKNALAAFLKNTGVDPLDLEENVTYTPNDYGDNEAALNFKDTLKTLQTDPEFAQTRQALLGFDDESKGVLFANSTALDGLHYDVLNGVYSQVMPQAEKMAALDGFKRPLLDYYLYAGSQYHAKAQQAAQANEMQKTIQQEELNKAKQFASLPTQRADKKKASDYLSDYDDDEEYNKWYKNLQSMY